LEDESPHVQRAAALALAGHPSIDHLRHLLGLRHRAPAEDTHLVHVVRMALRDQLQGDEVLAQLDSETLNERDARALADVAIAVRGQATPHAAGFLLDHLRRFDGKSGQLEDYARYIARHLPADRVDELAELAASRFGGQPELQLTLFESVQTGTADRGGVLPETAREWGAELAVRLLAAASEQARGWNNTPLPGVTDPTNPWFLQQRAGADGNRDAWFLCSLPPGGEQLTGTLRSPAFEIPGTLNFFLAGHDGPPDRPAQGNNRVRLRLVDSDVVVKEVQPPRNDIAQRISWDVPDHAGRKGYLEVIDRDTGNAYAWLAIGRFDPPVLKLPEADPRQLARWAQSAARIAGDLKLTGLAPALRDLLGDARADPGARVAAAWGLLEIDTQRYVPDLGKVLSESSVPGVLEIGIVEALAATGDPGAVGILAEELTKTAASAQARVARAMAGTAAGGEALLDAVSKGLASPHLLVDQALRQRLIAARLPDVEARLKRLTEGVPPADAEKQELVKARLEKYRSMAGTGSVEEGARVYQVNCAICHQVGGQGGLIGPQLDGIASRGAERLIEDILDPNRNVDHAFRYHTITLKSGQILTALERRREGEVVVFADTTGREIRVPGKEIEEQIPSEYSLMPSNFDELIPPEEFNDLIEFLLRQ
jgi:putative heme-binding domain-containing protein